MFAYINTANALYPGGGYLIGCSAQEENLFHRINANYTLTNDVVTEINGMFNVQEAYA